MSRVSYPLLILMRVRRNSSSNDSFLFLSLLLFVPLLSLLSWKTANGSSHLKRNIRVAILGTPVYLKQFSSLMVTSCLIFSLKIRVRVVLLIPLPHESHFMPGGMLLTVYILRSTRLGSLRHVYQYLSNFPLLFQ